MKSNARIKKPTIPPTIPPISAPVEAPPVLFALAGATTPELSGSAASTIVVATLVATVCPLELVVMMVVMVVRVEDESGVLWEVEVIPEVCFAVEAEDVLEGIMEATDGGKVVCPELKTAHAPDKTTISTCT